MPSLRPASGMPSISGVGQDPVGFRGHPRCARSRHRAGRAAKDQLLLLTCSIGRLRPGLQRYSHAGTFRACPPARGSQEIFEIPFMRLLRSRLRAQNRAQQPRSDPPAGTAVSAVAARRAGGWENAAPDVHFRWCRNCVLRASKRDVHAGRVCRSRAWSSWGRNPGACLGQQR